jgi:hypothetical protein
MNENENPSRLYGEGFSMGKKESNNVIKTKGDGSKIKLD